MAPSSMMNSPKCLNRRNNFHRNKGRGHKRRKRSTEDAPCDVDIIAQLERQRLEQSASPPPLAKPLRPPPPRAILPTRSRHASLLSFLMNRMISPRSSYIYSSKVETLSLASSLHSLHVDTGYPAMSHPWGHQILRAAYSQKLGMAVWAGDGAPQRGHFPRLHVWNKGDGGRANMCRVAGEITEIRLTEPQSPTFAKYR